MQKRKSPKLYRAIQLEYGSDSLLAKYFKPRTDRGSSAAKLTAETVNRCSNISRLIIRGV